MEISIIAAVAENGVIGKHGRLPWRMPSDLKHFKELTMGHGLVMGWKTWKDVSARTGLPLPGRRHYIVTEHHLHCEVPAACVTRPTIEQAIDQALTWVEKLFIIGGSRVFADGQKYASTMHITRIHANVDGDTSFPPIDETQWMCVARTAIVQSASDEYPASHEEWRRL